MHFSPNRTGGEPARLGVEHAVAQHLFGAILDQPGRAPFAAGLLVRHHGERDPARQLARAGGTGRRRRTSSAVVPHFMSTVPRPCTRPSAISPDQGSRAQAARSPTGKTSRWPFSTRWRPLPAPPSKVAIRLGWAACGASVRCAMPSRSRKARNKSAARRVSPGGLAVSMRAKRCRKSSWLVAFRVEPVQQLVRSGHRRANAGAGASWTTTPFLTTARHGAPPMA